MCKDPIPLNSEILLKLYRASYYDLSYYSLIKGYWALLNPKPYRSLKGTLGIP